MTYQKDEVFDVAALEIQAGYNRPYDGDRKCEMLMEAQRPYLLLDRYVAVNRTSPQDPQFNPPVIPVEVMNVSAVSLGLAFGVITVYLQVCVPTTHAYR